MKKGRGRRRLFTFEHTVNSQFFLSSSVIVQGGYAENLYDLNELPDSLGTRRILLLTNWNILPALWEFAGALFQPSSTPLETHLSLTRATREIKQLGNQQGQAESYLQMLAEKIGNPQSRAACVTLSQRECSPVIRAPKVLY